MDVALYNNGRVIPQWAGGAEVCFIDVMKGKKVGKGRFDRLMVDTSGAMLWNAEHGTVMAGSGPHGTAREISCLGELCISSFCYGVALDYAQRRVLRFDIESTEAVDFDLKVRVTMCVYLCVTETCVKEPK